MLKTAGFLKIVLFVSLAVSVVGQLASLSHGMAADGAVEVSLHERFFQWLFVDAVFPNAPYTVVLAPLVPRGFLGVWLLRYGGRRGAMPEWSQGGRRLLGRWLAAIVGGAVLPVLACLPLALLAREVSGLGLVVACFVPHAARIDAQHHRTAPAAAHGPGGGLVRRQMHMVALHAQQAPRADRRQQVAHGAVKEHRRGLGRLVAEVDLGRVPLLGADAPAVRRQGEPSFRVGGDDLVKLSAAERSALGGTAFQQPFHLDPATRLQGDARSVRSMAQDEAQEPAGGGAALGVHGYAEASAAAPATQRHG